MKETYVHFHIGRCGRFPFNAGHKTFVNFEDMQDCLKGEWYTIISEDEDGNTLPDEQWKMLRANSEKVLLEGRENIEAPDGIIDDDGEYNTDIFRNLEDCTEGEYRILGQLLLERTLPLCEYDDEIVRFIAKTSAATFDKFWGAVYCFNADCAICESEDALGEIAVSLFRYGLEELDKDDEDWADAITQLDLEGAVVDRIYANHEMKICFCEDFR